MKVIRFLSDTPRSDLDTWQHFPPMPAKGFVPKWYKDAELEVPPENYKEGLKACTPFLDSMLSGYVLVSWAATRFYKEDGETKWEYVELNEDGKYVSSNKDFDVIYKRDNRVAGTVPRPQHSIHDHFVWRSKWGWKTPKGWSSLVVHPLNRMDLPFTTMSGIIDSDEWATWGQIPFFLRDDFEGIIPAGTPIAQIIPIQRKTWISAVDETLRKKFVARSNEAHKDRSISGYYRKIAWKKKRYE